MWKHCCKCLHLPSSLLRLTASNAPCSFISCRRHRGRTNRARISSPVSRLPSYVSPLLMHRAVSFRAVGIKEKPIRQGCHLPSPVLRLTASNAPCSFISCRRHKGETNRARISSPVSRLTSHRFYRTRCSFISCRRHKGETNQARMSSPVSRLASHRFSAIAPESD